MKERLLQSSPSVTYGTDEKSNKNDRGPVAISHRKKKLKVYCTFK